MARTPLAAFFNIPVIEVQERDKVMNDDLREQMTALTNQMKHFHTSLEVKARDMEMAGGDAEVVSKLINGADAMRDSGNIYLSWAPPLREPFRGGRLGSR